MAQSGRDSKAVGSPEAGSLIRGVALQAEGQNHFTWDLPRGRSPNPRFRRYATSSVVRRTLKVVAAYSRAHPRAARVGIADLSLRRGGTFGLRYGGTGHVNHQNGTEADVLYPRRDGKERVALGRQVDKRLAQNLVNRFLRAGAVLVLVDSELALEGPPGRLDTAAFHDDHMHVRFAPR